MATKPDISLVRWGDGGSPNLAPPPSGTRDTGFQGGTPALSGQVNSLFQQHDLWARYLGDGDFDGPISVDGNLTVTGDVAVGDDLTVTDDAAVGGDLAVTGAATVGTTLGVGTTLEAPSIINTPALPQGAAFTGGPFAFTGVVSPTSLPNGNTNNWAPTGIASAIVVRVTADVGAFLTGITALGAGQMVTLMNIGTNDLTITHEDGSSTAEHRFLLPNGATITLRDNGSITFWYDVQSQRYRVFSLAA